MNSEFERRVKKEVRKRNRVMRYEVKVQGRQGASTKHLIDDERHIAKSIKATAAVLGLKKGARGDKEKAKDPVNWTEVKKTDSWTISITMPTKGKVAKTKKAK